MRGALPGTPYRYRVPARHQRVLLTLYRASEEDLPVSTRIIASRSGVPLRHVWPILRKLREHGWAEKTVLNESYTMPVYGLSLTEAGRAGVVQLMRAHRWKMRHSKPAPKCKWSQNRIEGEHHGASAPAGT